MKKLIFLFLLTQINFACSQNKSSAIVENINQEQFQKMLNDNNTVVLDVRTPGEVAQGYIPGTDLFINWEGCCFKEEMSKLDTSKTYLVYCRSGARSGAATNAMAKNGFNKIYNLRGGINNWSGKFDK
jgi:rhodanese-related sulfurtransferase